MSIGYAIHLIENMTKLGESNQGINLKPYELLDIAKCIQELLDALPLQPCPYCGTIDPARHRCPECKERPCRCEDGEGHENCPGVNLVTAPKTQVSLIFALGFIRMDGVSYRKDYCEYGGKVGRRFFEPAGWMARYGYIILYHEGRTYLKKGGPDDIEALKALDIIPPDSSPISGDEPTWLPSSYVQYDSEDLLERVLESWRMRV